MKRQNAWRCQSQCWWCHIADFWCQGVYVSSLCVCICVLVCISVSILECFISHFIWLLPCVKSENVHFRKPKILFYFLSVSLNAKNKQIIKKLFSIAAFTKVMENRINNHNLFFFFSSIFFLFLDINVSCHEIHKPCCKFYGENAKMPCIKYLQQKL